MSLYSWKPRKLATRWILSGLGRNEPWLSRGGLAYSLMPAAFFCANIVSRRLGLELPIVLLTDPNQGGP